jgi:hypothetical protein
VGAARGLRANRPLVQELLRETPQYKAAREAGQTEAQALKTLGADAALMKSLREEKARLSAGFMALDPRNGQVRAWVGSRDFIKDQFDHVAQARRQPGSTFKPFVYGAAFAQGMSPGEVLMDEPVEIALGGGQVWRPTDGGEPSYLPMTLRDGLALSKNTITAQVVQRVGAQRVAALARAMGVRQSKLEEVLSLALGTSPVTLREMVAAYGTLANGGNYIEPTVILQVEDRDGKVLEAFAAPAPEPALPQPAADRLLDALRGAIDAARARRSAALWHPGRRGRQDRHHPGQHRRLVHPDAPAPGGGRVGGLQRQPPDHERRLRPGCAQRAAHGGGFLPGGAAYTGAGRPGALCRAAGVLCAARAAAGHGRPQRLQQRQRWVGAGFCGGCAGRGHGGRWRARARARAGASASACQPVGPGALPSPMRKTYPLRAEGKHPDRVLDAVKHDIRKYLKRERRRELPEGTDFWDFDCKFGLTAEAATPAHLATVIPQLDAAAREAAAAAAARSLSFLLGRLPLMPPLPGPVRAHGHGRGLKARHDFTRQAGAGAFRSAKMGFGFRR